MGDYAQILPWMLKLCSIHPQPGLCPTVCSEITDTLSFKKTVGFFRKTVVFTQIALKFTPDFLLSTLFSNWCRRLNLYKKARFLENRRKRF